MAKKCKKTEGKADTKQKEVKVADEQEAKEQGEAKNTLLDHYIQRQMSHQLEKMDEKAIAYAIKTLLEEDKEEKTLH